MIKTVTALIALALASTLVAGSIEPKTIRQSYSEEEYFKAGEIQLDAFGVYAHSSKSVSDHSLGGGLGANYFFTEYLGAGVDGYYLDSKSGQVAGSVIARYPIGHFAPYALVGGGGLIDSNQFRALGKAGAGVEYKFTPNLGLKADYTWNVVKDTESFGALRAGLSYSF